MARKNTEDLLKVTFDNAETYYYKHFTRDHQRIDPDDDYDPEVIKAWGRAWLIVLAVSGWEEDRTPGEMLLELYRISCLTADAILEAMYG